eukprot:66917_1
MDLDFGVESILTVAVKDYNVFVGQGIRHHIASHVVKIAPSSRYVIITDENVGKLYSKEIVDQFEGAGLTTFMYTIIPGEQSKCRSLKATIEDWMLAKRCNRDTLIIALGGGVVGDLAGFVASTYMRGIPFVQVPTSVLACVDSSIGGKTGIDTPAGKNLVGTFHQPKAVYVDLEFLKTLPIRELSNGMAEIIKAGAIRDEKLFCDLESNAAKILECDLEALKTVIHRGIEIKANVVRADERERGVRSILNFGHSVGHALEAADGACSSGTLGVPSFGAALHGECVARGMVVEARVARGLGFLGSGAIRRMINCLKAYKLPTEIPSYFRVDDLLHRMAVDKKNVGGSSGKKLVMLTSIGSVNSEPAYTTSVSDDQLKFHLSPATAVCPGLPASGSLAVPGSKSISNRVLLIAALGRGTCRIRGLLHSEDTQVMLDSLEKLGVSFEWEDQGAVLVMHGCAGKLSAPSSELYLANAGTASRFLTSACTLIESGEIILTGSKRMHERPVGDLVSALQDAGCSVACLGPAASLPLRVTGLPGGFPGGNLRLRATVSSQFVSSVLITAPYGRKETELQLEGGKAVSPTYIDMTITLMKQFGISVTRPDEQTYVIPNGVYENPPEFLVEGDASSATYPLALAAISGGTITVTNVGESSIQGDAGFANLLVRMGCSVTRTATSTTVSGPQVVTSTVSGQQTSLVAPTGEVDMGDMTDAFMTAAAVAAVARGTTRIVNIANQRVKECNRIEAMVTELRKCGISARELETGIEIVGDADRKFAHGAVINCYKDHRIAMSFAVLGARVDGVVVSDKQCVDKTYPSFWDAIQRFLGVKLDPNAYKRIDHRDVRTTSHGPNPDSTVVIIGMRATGKSGLGAHSARVLGRKFIDLDVLIEEKVGEPILTFIPSKGWDAFRKVELEVFLKAIHDHPTDSIISCGGGIVEIPSAVEVLCALPCVVQINRNIEDVEQHLVADRSRPDFQAEIREVWYRREALYEDASQFEFYIQHGDHDWKAIRRDFVAFLRRILCTRLANAAELGACVGLGARECSHFLSLTYVDLQECIPVIDEISRGVDALEVRVDLLKDISISSIKEQLSLLRRASPLPLVFTVRSRAQGGGFNGDERELFGLLRIGVRLGCEFVDMECCWGEDAQQALLDNRGRSKIIGSLHFPGENGGSVDELKQLFVKCSKNNRADVAKLVTTATHTDDAIRIITAAHALRGDPEFRPGLIALAMGEAGKLSRVFNQTMTPVTHPLLPSSAAPGQLSVESLESLRSVLGRRAMCMFYLFGDPVELSPSPDMHNAGFSRLWLSHVYSACETDCINDLKEIITKSDFGGASVTIPLKEKVIPLMDSLAESARKIGAVNTIIKNDDGSLLGENTDWIGIYRPLYDALSKIGKLNIGGSDSNTAAVVLGAGGTARAAVYALHALGFGGARVHVWNRTLARAEVLAADFGCAVIHAIDDVTEHISVVLSTLPAKAKFTLPEWILEEKPVVFDVSIYPRDTALIQQARKFECPTVCGTEMLLHQGLNQFELWTGRRAPFDVMRDAIEAKYKAVMARG